jgi:uncharacterized membrane protein/Mg-chelatase subunit ChlD
MKPWSRIAEIITRSGRPITFLSLLPLVIFLVGFGFTCVSLEATRRVLFSNPSAFLLTLLTPVLWWIHHNGYHGLNRVRSFTALMTRLILCGVLIMLMAEPRAVRESDVTAVVYALDVSDSIGEETADSALSYIVKTAQEKPEKDLAGLVVFGLNSAVELPPRVSFPFEIINARVTREGTSLERGLSLAAAMLPEEHAGRVVLISDGVETEGNALGVLDEFNARSIPVDTLSIAYDYDHEVWLETLDVPRRVKIGESYEASVVLSSLRAGKGKLILYENDTAIHEQSVSFQAGKNRYTLPLYFRQAGYYEYTARIEVPDGEDGWKQNNVAVNYVYLQGKGKVLVVTSPEGNDRDWEHLVRAMGESGLIVERIESYGLPRDSISLLPYDGIVFPNVPADAFDAAQFQAVRDAVYNHGTGFLMVGGKDSFGPGGYHRTQIEEALPVTMDVKQEKVLPKGALAIVLHTCEFPEGNTWGKRIAKQAMRVLGSQDEIGILVYSYSQNKPGEQWLFPMTPAAEYERLVPLINNAQIGDMPSFSTTMKMGLDGLSASDAATKHMIVISDGDPSPPTPELVNDFADAGISISTVAMNPHGGQEVAIMQAISRQTGGRYYFPQDPSQLPSIFIKEAKTLKRSMIQNKTFIPALDYPSPIMKGIDAIPSLHGYVITTAKSRARTILRYEGEEPDPVLSVWRFGLGTTAAFTSDLASNWGRDWIAWDKYRAYIKQLMTAVLRVQSKHHLFMQTYARGATGYITAEDYHPDAGFLEIEAEVTSPDTRKQKVTLKQVGPQLYQATFPLSGVGRYQVLAAASSGDRIEHVTAGFTVPYSPEYLRFRADPAIMRSIAAKTGGRTLTGEESGQQIYNENRKIQRSSVPIMDWFLWALAILVPIDVGVRRLQLDWLVIREWFGRGRNKTSTQTLGTLLRRKEEVRTRLDTDLPAEPRPGPTPAAPAKKAARERKTIHAEDSQPTDEPTSTTARLLERKRKWKQDDKDDSKPLKG